MPETITYARNDDVQVHVPIKFTNTSRPTTSQIANFRLQVYGMINLRLGGAKTDTHGGLKTLEVNKVLEMLDNYWARGRGERTLPVEITDEDIAALQLTTGDDSGSTGGHYSVEVP